MITNVRTPEELFEDTLVIRNGQTLVEFGNDESRNTTE